MLAVDPSDPEISEVPARGLQIEDKSLATVTFAPVAGVHASSAQSVAAAPRPMMRVARVIPFLLDVGPL
jgi:hypothetical protein